MRVQMVWHMKNRREKLDFSSILGKVRLSVGVHFTVIHYEHECAGLEEVKKIFVQFQVKGLYCRSLKLFEPGHLPKMDKYGFHYNGLFYYNAKHDFVITAVPYGNEEWCMLIERRTGDGVHLRMLHAIPYFQETYAQLSLDDLSSSSA